MLIQQTPHEPFVRVFTFNHTFVAYLKVIGFYIFSFNSYLKTTLSLTKIPRTFFEDNRANNQLLFGTLKYLKSYYFSGFQTAHQFWLANSPKILRYRVIFDSTNDAIAHL